MASATAMTAAAAARPFDLLETMRFDPHDGVVDLERHLARMKGSAEALGYTFDRHGTRNELQAATFHLRAPARLRLLLSPGGATAIEVGALPPAPSAPVSVAIVPLPFAPDDPRLHHSHNDRAFADEARRATGAFAVAFVDARGFLAGGGSITLFVAREGRLLTPPRTRGAPPGVLRARLIEEGRAVEQDLRVDDLAGGFLIGNALTGLIPAICVAPADPPGL